MLIPFQYSNQNRRITIFQCILYHIFIRTSKVHISRKFRLQQKIEILYSEYSYNTISSLNECLKSYCENDMKSLTSLTYYLTLQCLINILLPPYLFLGNFLSIPMRHYQETRLSMSKMSMLGTVRYVNMYCQLEAFKLVSVCHWQILTEKEKTKLRCKQHDLRLKSIDMDFSS